jgi:3-hydroxyisobutyrate dehydrogenase-like beta-hydroxyacid dehydrogenase
MEKDMTKRIGFVGVGMMGHGMAKNLLQKGYSVTIKGHKNRAPVDDLVQQGAAEAVTSAQVAQQSDIVFLCVTGTPQVEEVVFGAGGLIEGAQSGLVIVDTSTAEPASTNAIRARLGHLGVTFVDAPLARTPKEAEEGRLNTMVGAEPQVFAALKPVLQAFCENVVHVGPPGAGHVVKLANNFIAMTIACATAEAGAAVKRMGVNPQKLVDVVSLGAVNNGIFQAVLAQPLQGNFSALKFALDNARKDIRYYTHMTEGLPMTSIMGEATHQSLVNACMLGFGEEFVPSLIKVQEKLNGTNVVG